MVTLRLLDAVRKAGSTTAGSGTFERGFDVRAETGPNLEVSRVAVVWTANGWQTVEYTECRLTGSRAGADTWAGSIGYTNVQDVTFFFALAAATRDGLVWANNHGGNYRV